MPIDTDILLRAYSMGIFPMADARDDDDIFWVEPEMRAIIPLNGLKISKSLRKTIRQDKFEVTSDSAFADVIALCAQSASDRKETWINQDIEQAFIALYQRGFAHSVECWQMIEGRRTLVGGLYGLALGRVFCGESMFSRRTDASKVALVWLVARLRAGGFELLDTQFMTDHLATMGAIELPQSEYLKLLHTALRRDYSSNAESGRAFKPPAGSVPFDVDGGAGDGCAGDGWAAVSSDGAADAAPRGAGVWGVFDIILSSGISTSNDDKSLGGGEVSPGKSMMQSLTQTS